MAGAVPAVGQPVNRNDIMNVRYPTVSSDGSTIYFAASTRPDAQADQGTNLYSWVRQPSAPVIHRLTNFATGASYVGVTGVSYPGSGEYLVYSVLPNTTLATEEIHLFNLTHQTDVVLATDSLGCPQVTCIGCVRTCVRSVHLSPDGSTALYSVGRQQPFYTAKADQSGTKSLNTYQGDLAPSSQRVIASSGVVVFTSTAPSGPTLAAQATDVYTMNLDGSNLKRVTNLGDVKYTAQDAVISKNGSLIAFSSNYSTSGSTNSQVFVVNPDGTGLRQISTGTTDAVSPSLSDDGSTVTYVQGTAVKSAGTGAGGSTMTVTNLTFSQPTVPVISNDGAQVVFSLGPTFGTPAAVYRAATTTAGQNLRQLTPIFNPPVLFSGGVVSAAGKGHASPGSLISVYGANLGLDDLAVAQGFPLSPVLKEVSLLVNGVAVPVLSTTPWQVNAQLPQTLSAGTPSFAVQYDGTVTTASVSGTVTSVAPENYTVSVTPASGSPYSVAAVLNATTGVLADADHPVRAGQYIEIYGSGLGLTIPQVQAGVASPTPPAQALVRPQLLIGGLPAPITFSGLAPGFAGLYQINAMVPNGVGTGLQTLSWAQQDGSQISASGIYIQ